MSGKGRQLKYLRTVSQLSIKDARRIGLQTDLVIRCALRGAGQTSSSSHAGLRRKDV